MGIKMKMKKYKTLLRAGIRSQRGSFVGILILVFMITISLCAILSIWQNANAHEQTRIEEAGYGDISYWLSEVSDEGRECLLEQIRALDEVEKAETKEILSVSEYEVRTKEKTTTVTGSLHILEWADGRYTYPVYRENLTGIEENPEDLADGEIYVSPAFSSLYGAKIGDVIKLTSSDGSEAFCYTIKGFFEDCVEGSAMMGIKQALMAKDDMERLAGQGGALPVDIFHIHQAEREDITIGELQKTIAEKTDLAMYPGFSYTKSAIMGFMLILQNLFSGLFLIFVLVLFVVAVIIIGHSISSSIEQDYVDMGILKALGYTCSDLRNIQLLQYLTAVVCGMIPGVPVSLFVVRGINRLTVTVTGLLIPSDIPIALSLLALGFLLLLIAAFICIRTAGIGRITPIRAIRGGAEDVYFKSRLTAPVHKKALSFWLACRQLVSGKKQYVSVCFITALLVFFLSLFGRMGAWLGPDGKGLMDVFGASPYDLGVEYVDEGVQDEAEAFIKSRTGILDSYLHKMSRASVNGVEYLMNVVSEPEYYNILEGRTCLYRNELVITETVAEETDTDIGDTVMLRYMGGEFPFLISGIYQSANDMGANFGISKEGYESLGAEEEERYYTHYLLEDETAAEEIAESLQENYGEKLNVDLNTWSGVDSITAVTSVLLVFMYLITIVFVFVTVALSSSKILYKEKHDLGIYKSLGFASGSLRCAFALRFCITAAAGSVIGVLLSAYLTDPLASSVLKICGVSHFTSALSLGHMLLPAVVVSVLFLAFSYLAAGKIKKVEPGILIVE